MSHPALSYTLIHKEFFETLDRYQPTGELLTIAERTCPGNWRIERGGFWTFCCPRDHSIKLQGWKIHVSGTDLNAADLLNRLLPILVDEKTPFKFCSDLAMVGLSTSKNWHRTGAGKFITIYPENTEQFIRLTDLCHQATRDLAGPHILTDRPYKDSRVIFYRYGGHSAAFRTDPDGQRISIIKSPAGEIITDERLPFFYVPIWEKDPFEPQAASSSTVHPNKKEVFLRGGRYRVNGALRYSAVGGIYTAVDTSTGFDIIIREARPLLKYSVEVLQKEARILQKLKNTGVAPQFVELFEEGGHWFLAQERLQAESLWGYAMEFTLGETAYREPQQLFNAIRDTVRKIAEALTVVHEKQIIIRDLTKTNVLFTREPSGESVKFIDFEFAHETDLDEHLVPGFTAGYASPQQRKHQYPRPEDDYYALGVLILEMVAFTGAGLDLNRSGILAALRQTLDDLGLPQVIGEIVENLTAEDPGLRMSPQEVMQKLDAVKVIKAIPRDSIMFSPEAKSRLSGVVPDQTLKQEFIATLNGITDYICSHQDLSRADRLWPSSPAVFSGSPVSIRFGATGISYYLLRVNGSVSPDVIDWILRHSDPRTSPPGLYGGLAGVALFLFDAGFTDEAKGLLKAANDPDRVCAVTGLDDGLAGWGLANLHFWQRTGDGYYLDEAVRSAKQLQQLAQASDEGTFWTTNGKTFLGFGHGASGIGLFLLYLYQIVREPEYLDLATRAISFDISSAAWLAGRVYHHDHKDADSRSRRSPHMRYGSGGVGTAALRLYAVTGEERFRIFAEDCAYTLSSRYTNKLWQDWGLAGFGEFLLDSYLLLGSDRYLHAAYHVAEGLLPYRICRSGGIAFPGSDLLKISCDYGLGSAGIGFFLHRLLNPRSPRLLFLDELLTSKITTCPDASGWRIGL